MGCCTAEILRGLLFLYNIFILVIGLGCFAVGIWMNADPYLISYFVVLGNGKHEGVLFSSTVILIVAGMIIIGVGLLGCLGLMKNNRGMLKGFIFLLAIIFLFQISIGAMCLAFNEDIHRHLKSGMKEQIKKKYQEDSKVGDAWDFIQVRKACCGVDEAADFDKSEWWFGQNAGVESHSSAKVWVPKTCCVLQFNQARDLRNVDPEDAIPKSSLRCQQDAQGRIDDGNNVHKRGCYAKLLDFIHEYTDSLIVIGFVTAGIQIIGIIFAYLLLSTMKDSNAVPPNQRYPQKW